MIPFPKTLEADVIKAVKNTPAKYFDNDDSDPENGLFMFSTRDNGDVGDEAPGKEDIKAAHKATTILKEAFPQAVITPDTCDEWTNLTIQFPPQFFTILPEAPKALRQAVEQVLIPALNKINFNTQITEIQEEMVNCYNNNQPNLKEQTPKIKIKGNSLFIVQNHPHSENFNWTPAEVSIQLNKTKNKEYLELRLNYHKEAIEITSLKEIPEKIEKLLSSIINTEAHISYRTDLWSCVPGEEHNTYSQNLNAYKCIGYATHEYCDHKENKFYELPNGGYLFIDKGEDPNKDPITIWKIPQDKLELAIHNLTEYFTPEAPEGSKSIKDIIQEISERIFQTIHNEAKERNTTTLEKHGYEGEIYQTPDGEFYLIPVEET